VSTGAPVDDGEMDLEAKVGLAQTVLARLLRAGHPVACSWSAGKDSSTVLNLLLTTAAHLKRKGVVIPPIVVTHADTMVENPDMVRYAQDEMKRVRHYARQNDLTVKIETATPLLTEQWVVRVVSGRALPTFPGTNRDCVTSLKIKPMTRLRKRVMKALGNDTEPVVLLGTRYDESVVRNANMRERGESAVEIRRGIDEHGKPSHLFLSPLAHWSSDDVWEYLAMARAGAIPAYSNFEETFGVYADAMGTSCVIVAEDMSKSLKASKACGARHGCALCTASTGKDQSMENMLASDPRYDYMRGLNHLRNFIVNTRWDMDRRSWIGRTINNGYVRVGPDAYSPAMMEELLRYSLTIDAVEREAASAARIAPRFQLVNIEQLFAIDAMWSLQAFHRPFHALKIYDDIQAGLRFPVPEVQPYPRPKDLTARYRFVGRDWEDGHAMAYTGLRSAVHELVASESQGCMGTKTLADGRDVMDVNTGEMFEIDAEGAFFVLDELPRLLREYHDNPRAHATQAYFYYASLGLMSVKAGMQGEVDAMLRRANYKERNGLAGQIDGRALWASSLTAEQAGMGAAAGRRARGEDGSRSTLHLSLVDLAVEDDAPAHQPGTPQARGDDGEEEVVQHVLFFDREVGLRA
jgi:DNA sulfur modification protein DndC